MWVSAIRVQDKDTWKKLSVIESKEIPWKYWLVLVNPDGSRISWPKGDPGPAGPSICSAEFNWDDIDFGRSDGCTVKLEDAKICLQGPSWNGICCTTCTKDGKTTKIQFDYTNWDDFCFWVQDGQDWQGSGDMLKCVYDPNNCEKNVFDYNNLDNKPSIPTDNCQLCNGCGYTTCMGTLVPSDLNGYAKTCEIPTDNCQLGNSCGYATCNYVNDSINSVTAYYITKDAQWNQFATYAELSAATTFYSWGQVRVPTKNDYTIVLDDENHDNATTRYLYNNGWEYQYTVNETALTQAQLDAINSGITCSKVSCYDNCMAQCCDIPTDNCELSNGCWYAKSCDLCSVATSWQYCDLSWQPTIPTDNCQLSNGCWYITWINCNDVTTALWYTPYDSTNPNWYTSCTGTVVASDIANLAQCCDIPTDNCQLTNGCWYTTCTGTLVSSDIACVNGCCLTNWWNITISWGADYSWCTQTISWGNVTLCLRTIVNVPTSDFTLVKPATLLDWEEYAIRIISETSYCMCLGSCFTNPWNVDTCLSGNATDQYVFLSIGWELELQPLVDTWA